MKPPLDTVRATAGFRRTGWPVALLVVFVAAPAWANEARLRLRVSPLAACAQERLGVELPQPTTRLDDGAPLDSDELLAAVEPDEGRWLLVVSDGSTRRLLRRELPEPAADCTEFAATVALMLRRYLAEIRFAAPAPATPAGRRLPEPQEPVVSRTSDAPVVTPRRLELLLGVTAGPSLGPGPLGLGALLGTATPLGPVRLALEAGLRLPETVAMSQEAGKSSYSVLEGSVRLWAGRPLDLGRGTLIPAATLGAEATRVDAQGELLFRRQAAWSVWPSVGVGLGYELPLFERDRLVLRAQGRAVLGQTRFVVEGAATQVVTPRYDGGLALVWARSLL